MQNTYYLAVSPGSGDFHSILSEIQVHAVEKKTQKTLYTFYHIATCDVKQARSRPPSLFVFVWVFFGGSRPLSSAAAGGRGAFREYSSGQLTMHIVLT